MNVLGRLLILVLVVEIAIGVYALGMHLRSAVPPTPSTVGLDSQTIAAIRKLMRRATGGGAQEWADLGEACIGIGDYPTAEQCLRRAVALDPESIQHHYTWGFTLERMGRLEEAVSELTAVGTHADPELAATCWYQVGRCELRRESAGAAEAAFQKAVGLPAAAYQIAKLQIRSDRAAEAAQLLDALSTQFPNSLKLVQLRAKAADAMGEVNLADSLRDELECTVENFKLDYGLEFSLLFRMRFGLGRLLAEGSHYEKNGTLEQRLSSVERMVEPLRSDQLWYYSKPFASAARLQVDRGQALAALNLLDEIESHNEPTAETLELRGDALALEKKVDQAATLWLRALRLSPSPTLHRKLAEIPSNPDVALSREEHLSAAAEMEGVDEFRRREYSSAVQRLGEAIQWNPANSRAHFYLGETARRLGDQTTARTAYDRCLQLDPHYFRALQAINSERP